MPIPPILIPGPAASENARKNDPARWRAWKKKVETEVDEHWGRDPLPASCLVAVTITYFAQGGLGEDVPGEPHDVDNLAKPILDAMEKVVYVDDRQVSDLLCRMRYLKTSPPPLNPPEGLDEYLRQQKPVVVIKIDPNPCPTVEL